MALNIKVGLIGKFDMLKFKNMKKVREQAIQAAPAKEIDGEFAINTNAGELHPDYVELVIDQIIDHGSAAAKTYVFKRAGGKPFPYFRAGQYLSLKLPLGDSFVTRSYSLCSSPELAKKGEYHITVKRDDAGFVSPYIQDNWKVGQAVTISGPQGHLYYEPLRDAKKVIALAGGSGTNRGTGGMVTKLQAAKICMGCGCDMVIANGNNANNLYDILEGKEVGTRFTEVQ